MELDTAPRRTAWTFTFLRDVFSFLIPRVRNNQAQLQLRGKHLSASIIFRSCLSELALEI
jgi:hypothetical protein